MPHDVAKEIRYRQQMESITAGTHIYEVQPGVPHVVAYQTLAAATITVAWREERNSSVTNTFRTTTGTTEATATAADESNAWLIIPPTPYIVITTDADLLLAVQATAGHDLTDPEINASVLAGAIGTPAAAVRWDIPQTLDSTELEQVAANVGMSDATPNTLVARDGSGSAQFESVIVNEITSNSNTLSIKTRTGREVMQIGRDSIADDRLLVISADNVLIDEKPIFRGALGSGSTGDALFTASTPYAAMAALGVQTRLQTTDSATRNTTTYADSIQITPITLLAGITYDIHFFATFACENTAGIKIRLTCAAFPTIVRMIIATPTTPATLQNSGINLEVLATNSAFTAGTGIREVRGSFRPTANTTLVMQWATNSTPSGGDTAQILAGTFLRATPIF